MALFKKVKDKITNKPTTEQIAFDTAVKLDQLKKKYEKYLIVQRRILKGNPTPREKELAEAKIRSGICAYTVTCETARMLEEINSEAELNKAIKELNQALGTVNRLAGKTGPSRFVNYQLNKRINKMHDREDKVQVNDIFNDDSQAAIDSWLGSKWADVSNKFINGADLGDCMRDSKMILEEDPIPTAFGDAFAGGDESVLEDLLNSDLF
ncbi:MAG: hypothetical protein Q4F43_00895 [Eubacteriales bacterium]|nr:hypothetical protein [Eubacteriales bacterium]